MKKPKETKAMSGPTTLAEIDSLSKAVFKGDGTVPVMFSNEQVDRDPSLIVGMVEVAHNGTHKWYRPE